MDSETELNLGKLIENSGNNLHCKAVKFLRDERWDVLVGPYYNDIITNKSREIDIIAQKLFPVKDDYGVAGKLYLRLFIECKYIKNDTVFWFDKKDYVRLGKKMNSVLPFEIYNQYGYFNEKIKANHYYFGDKVAKIFTSNKDRNFENEVIYGALNQSLNSLVYYKDEKHVIVNNSNIGVNLEYPEWYLDYPVVVVNNYNQFYGVDMDSSIKPYRIGSSFQLETNYSYFDRKKNNTKTDYFLIDIVAEHDLEKMLNSIETNDVAPISELWALNIRENEFNNQSIISNGSQNLGPYDYQ